MFYRGLGSCKLELGLTPWLHHCAGTGQPDPPSTKAKTQGRLLAPSSSQRPTASPQAGQHDKTGFNTAQQSLPRATRLDLYQRRT